MFNFNVGNTARKLEALKNAYILPVNENNNNNRPSAMGNMNNINNMNNMNNMNMANMNINPNLNQNAPKMNVNHLLDNDQVLMRNQTGLPISNLGGTGQNFYKASQNLPRGTISANNIPLNNNIK
jgi:hypothetical protein